MYYQMKLSKPLAEIFAPILSSKARLYQIKRQIKKKEEIKRKIRLTKLIRHPRDDRDVGKFGASVMVAGA
jgi:hypothetical protein